METQEEIMKEHIVDVAGVVVVVGVVINETMDGVAVKHNLIVIQVLVEDHQRINHMKLHHLLQVHHLDMNQQVLVVQHEDKRKILVFCIFNLMYVYIIFLFYCYRFLFTYQK